VKAPATPTVKNKKTAATKARSSPAGRATTTARPAAKAVQHKSAPAKKAVPVKKPASAKKAAPLKSTAAAKKKPVPAKAGAPKKAVPASAKVAKPAPSKTAPAPKKKAAVPARKPLPVAKTPTSARAPATKPPASGQKKSAAPVAAQGGKASVLPANGASSGRNQSPPKGRTPAAPVRAPILQPLPGPASKARADVAPSGSGAIVIEPTPRPLGKRAAKKVMMEQMTQAVVVPTHSPNAAKATFSTSNERVMTPPVPSTVQKDPKRANNWKTLPVEQLTDQDVQAMPDAEYMNEVQLSYFRRKLTQLKADMLANAGETTEHLREDTVVVPDPADRATIEEEHALELRTRDRERKLLKKIEQAIARIDAGDYGYCEETGEAIGVGRLMARPTASLSLEAQQRRELKQKMFGD
jgi:DnaK suppressor protein